MPRTQRKPTLKDIHNELTQVPRQRKAAVLKVLGVANEQVFFNVLKGDRRCNEAEKEAIAKVYGRDADSIDWQEK